MFTFYLEEPEYFIFQPNTYPRSQFSKCRYYNQPPCSYHSNPYSSYSHPSSDSYFSPSYDNRNYYRNNESGDRYRRQYYQSPFHNNRNSYRQGKNNSDESVFSNSRRQYESFSPENLFNVQPNYMSRRPQSQNHGDEWKRKSTTRIPMNSRSIPITVPSDYTNNSVKVNNSKTVVLDKGQASKRIYKFLRHNTANYKTRNILSKLLQLRNIQNHLSSLASQNNQLALTFNDEQETSQVLLTTKDNKKFLEYEDNVLKVLDKLDGIDSNGCDIVRVRRKEIITLVQKILNQLDDEKERQWEEFRMNKRKEGEKDMIVEENVTTENSTLGDKAVVERSEVEEDNIAVDDVNGNEMTDGVEERKIEEEKVETIGSPVTVEEDEIKPYVISQVDDVEEIVLTDENQNDDASRDNTTKDLDIDVDSFVSINANESMDINMENTRSDLSPSKDEKINFDDEEKKLSTDDEFIMIESNE